MTREELDKDMIESIEMWLHEIEPKWVEKELAWLEELRTRLLEGRVPNDLEEAKEAYCEEHNDDCFDATGDKCPHIRNAFIAGAKWDRSQMMQEAVEGKIYGYGDGSYELVASWLDLPKGGIYKDGQKVRVIICKKEDKKDR